MFKRWGLAGALLLLFCVSLRAEISVSGRVLDSSKHPIASAQLSLFPFLDPGSRALVEQQEGARVPAARAESDASGIYHFVAPAAGVWILRADAKGFAPQEYVIAPLVEDLEIEDAKLQRDAGLRVVVAGPDKKPVARAFVRMSHKFALPQREATGWNPSPVSGFTDPEGAIRFANAPNDAVIVSVSSDGMSFWEQNSIQASTLFVTMAEGKTQQYSLLDAAGKPVPGVVALAGESIHPVGSTGENGNIVLRYSPQRQSDLLFLSRDGRSYRTRSPKVQSDKPIVLRLTDTSLLTGHVVDSKSRQPLEGAVILNLLDLWSSATTSRGGEFALSGPAGGVTRMKCLAAGHLEKYMLDFSFPKGGQKITLALDPSAAIEGIVIADGAPLAGATVRVDSGELYRGAPYIEDTHKARTGKDGKFRIIGLYPDLIQWVQAKAKGYAPVSTEFESLTAGKTRDKVRLELNRGNSVVGSVVNTEKQPVPSASVRIVPSKSVSTSQLIFSPGQPEEEYAEAMTDAQGRFVVPDLAPGKVDIQIIAKGFASKSLQGLDVPNKKEPVDAGTVVLLPGASLEGRIVDSKKRPVAEAAIYVKPAQSSFYGYSTSFDSQPSAVSGNDGWFQVADQTPGGFLIVRAEHEGYVAKEIRNAEVGGPVALIVELQEASRVSGVVVDSAGKAVPDAIVTLMQKIMRSAGNYYIRSSKRNSSNEDGVFEFKNVEPALYSIAIKASGWQDLEQDGIEVPQGKDVSNLKLVLQPEAMLEGNVTSSDGTPVSGATVRQITEDTRYYRPQTSSAITDGAGAYQLHGIKPGKVSVQVSQHDYVAATKDLELKPGSNHQDFQMDTGHDVAGRVVDETGAGIAGVTLESYTDSVESNEEGIFRFHAVADGEATIDVSKNGYTTTQTPLKVHVAGANVEGLTVSMKHGVSLTGGILGIEPDKFPQIVIEGTDNQSQWLTTKVDLKGDYRLTGLVPGTWNIAARLQGTGRQAASRVTIQSDTGDQHLDLEFGKGIVLTGHVLLAGEPQSGMQVSVSQKGTDSTGASITLSDGSFKIEGLEKGAQIFMANDWQRNLRYRKEFDLENDQDLLIEIPTMNISGKILDGADHSPLSGANVGALPVENQDYFSNSVGATITDADGAFQLKNVSTGGWTVTARKDGYAAASQPVTITDGQSVENLELSLNPTEGLTLEFHYAVGGFPSFVWLGILDSANHVIVGGSYRTRESGRVRLSSVPAGTWKILASADGSAMISANATAPKPEPDVITLPPGCGLKISVPDLVDDPSNAVLTLINEQGQPFLDFNPYVGSANDHFPLSNGAKNFDALPAGTWAITVTAGDRTWTKTITLAAGSTTDVILQRE